MLTIAGVVVLCGNIRMNKIDGSMTDTKQGKAKQRTKRRKQQQRQTKQQRRRRRRIRQQHVQLTLG